MGQIIILDENTSNQIAAGEVVENPASVVKELVENSIDAGSSNITIEIKKGGITQIKIIDNGCGMPEDDVQIAFERHATSKIRSSNDLEGILTLGFRGEALASIASVAIIELTTRTKDKSFGTYIRVKGGIVEETSQIGCPVGTTFIVRDLFFNTPARFKFLKKDYTEARYISDMINRIALGNPSISFKLVNNKKTVIRTPGNNDLLSTIFSLYGKETANECIKISYKDDMFSIKGFAGKPSIARSNRNWQSIYVNGRYIKNKTISAAIDEAYKTNLMKNKFAFAVLNIKVNPVLVDVNVHPTKMEVRFTKEQEIFRAVYYAINNALLSESLIKNIKVKNKKNDVFKYQIDTQKSDYIQQEIKYTESKKLDSADELVESSPIESLETKSGEEKPRKENSGEKLKENFEEKFREKPKKGESTENKYLDNPKPIVSESSSMVDMSSKINTPSKKNENKKIKMRKENQNTTDINDFNNSKITEQQQSNEKSILIDSKIIGQIFSTYIILQSNKNLVLIDQHAAHERIIFENLKEKYYKKENLAQYLLEPIVIELVNHEIEFINDKNETLNELGFIIENFGDNSIILRSVPVNGENGSVKESFLNVLDFLMSEHKKDDIYIIEEVLYKMACKLAVKANEKLDKIEIQNILKKLSHIENPYTCPHGRPTIIKITKHELEKMFKRIV